MKFRIGVNPAVTRMDIRERGVRAATDGDSKLQTLCEVALGGRAQLNQVARLFVEDTILRERRSVTP